MKEQQFAVTIFEKDIPMIGGNIISISLDGAKINTIQKLHDELKGPLKFPGNYSSSTDALCDVLCDLAWLKEQPVYLVITNFDFFLDGETQEKKIQALLALVDAGATWLEMKGSEKFFAISIQKTMMIQDLLEMCEVNYQLT
jgi:RNAse (barnase) inhibitor barstar